MMYVISSEELNKLFGVYWEKYKEELHFIPYIIRDRGKYKDIYLMDVAESKYNSSLKNMMEALIPKVMSKTTVVIPSIGLTTRVDILQPYIKLLIQSNATIIFPLKVDKLESGANVEFAVGDKTVAIDFPDFATSNMPRAIFITCMEFASSAHNKNLMFLQNMEERTEATLLVSLLMLLTMPLIKLLLRRTTAKKTENIRNKALERILEELRKNDLVKQRQRSEVNTHKIQRPLLISRKHEHDEPYITQTVTNTTPNASRKRVSRKTEAKSPGQSTTNILDMLAEDELNQILLMLDDNDDLKSALENIRHANILQKLDCHLLVNDDLTMKKFFEQKAITSYGVLKASEKAKNAYVILQKLTVIQLCMLKDIYPRAEDILDKKYIEDNKFKTILRVLSYRPPERQRGEQQSYQIKNFFTLVNLSIDRINHAILCKTKHMLSELDANDLLALQQLIGQEQAAQIYHYTRAELVKLLTKLNVINHDEELTARSVVQQSERNQHTRVILPDGSISSLIGEEVNSKHSNIAGQVHLVFFDDLRKSLENIGVNTLLLEEFYQLRHSTSTVYSPTFS